MKSLYALLLIVCAAGICSCSSQQSSDPQSPIVGLWTLQQEHVQVTEDNATMIDTVLKAGGATHSSVTFNSDGTYSASAAYVAANTTLQQTIPPSNQSSNGTYSYTGSQFTIQPGLAGWYAYVSGSSTIPVTNSNITQVTAITTSIFNVHTGISFTITNGSGAHTITQVCDFYYTK